MKKILLMALAVIAFSCSDDDNLTSHYKKSIVGTWILSGISTGEEFVPNDENCAEKGHIEFNNDGTLHTQSVSVSCDITRHDMTYNINGNVLTLFRDNSGLRYEIVKLTDSLLEYKTLNSRPEDPQITLYYTKQ